MAAIVVAAGRGQRVGGSASGPKQYVRIGSETVLARAIGAFARHEAVSIIQPVIHRDDMERYKSAVAAAGKIEKPAFGGNTRQESVLAGLRAISRHRPDLVLIHDAARPFVDADTISAVIGAIERGVCALPAFAQPDTLKRVDRDGFVAETLPRGDIYCAQTPQGFVFEEILEAHLSLSDSGQTDCSDDAQVAERAGMRVRIVPSSAANAKITTAQDMRAFSRLWSDGSIEVRTGNGFDVHAFEDGDCLILCGISIPFDRGLKGHSDADVGLHAVTDAILGAAGLGDIGEHFPPSDPKWKDAPSHIFLAHAVSLLRQHGGTVANLDITLLCEAPKIAPHRQAMRASVAAIAGIAPSKVSVKATTTEGLGFVGRREGIAAIATATVRISTRDPMDEK